MSNTKKQESEKYIQWRKSMTLEEKEKINAWLKENNQPYQFVGTGRFAEFIGKSQQSVRNYIKDQAEPLFYVESKLFTAGTFEGKFIDIYWFRNMASVSVAAPVATSVDTNPQEPIDPEA